MADISDINAALSTKIIGANSSGLETNPVDATINGLKVDGSAVTQPVTGTGTGGTPATGVITVQGIQTGIAQKTVPLAPYASNSYPNPIQAYPDAEAQSFGNDFALNADVFGNLQTRGPVITDETSSRNDFSGSSISTTLTGNVKFANNDTQVDGTGTSFTTEVKSGSYLKRTAGADTEWVQVDYVQDDSTLFLVSVYSGNFNNVPFMQTEYDPMVTGGASYNVGSSLLNLVSSTASGNSVFIERQGDYLPFNLQFSASITQRIANQTATIGFLDNFTSPTKQAVIVFDGTTNTTIKFVTASSAVAADIQTTTVTLPGGVTTASAQTYQIDLIGQQACLLINGILSATHTLHLPGPYDVLKLTAGITNAAVVTTTTLSIDYLYFSNQNRLNVGNDFQSDPIATLSYGRLSTGALKELLVGSNGESNCVDYNTTKASYSAAALAFVPALTATDIFTLTGSATKTIRITRIQISATQTTATANNIVLLKRSTANTGGTSTTLTATPLDSANAAATAVARSYTANPTVGTLVGNLRVDKLFIPTTTGSPTILDWKFGEGCQPIYLRGVAQVLAVNLNSTTLAGNSFNIFIEWTEE
jgi:hypothetical protein